MASISGGKKAIGGPATYESFRGLSQFPLHDVGHQGYGNECTNFYIDQNEKPTSRLGMEAMKPAGGTVVTPIDAGYGGIYTGYHEHQTPWAWVLRRSAAGAFSGNYAGQAFYDLFDAVTVGGRLCIGAPQKFGSVLFTLGRLTGGGTIVAKYSKSDGTLAVLPGVTEDFNTALGQRRVSFSRPADWGAYSYDEKYGYWIFFEITGVLANVPTQTRDRIGADWRGLREIYWTASAEAASTANGKLLLQGDDRAAGTNTYRALSSSLFSAGNPRARMVSLRGNLYLVNGVDQKRWDGFRLGDVGFAKPTIAPDTTRAGTGLTGIFQWFVTLGYGPKGEWGESNELLCTTSGAGSAAPSTLTCLNQGASIAITAGFVAALPASVDVIYLYRSIDLSTVEQATTFANFPAYLSVTTFKDQVTGVFNPAGFAITDTSQELPKPLRPMKTRTNTPPARCKFIATHRGVLFLGANDLNPGRVWWAPKGATNLEAFDVDNIYFDPTGTRAGILTGLVEFADQMVLFYEADMYGVTDTEQDQASIYSIISGIGCVAPESICINHGYLMWLSRNGIYRWDGINPPERVSKHLLDLEKLSFDRHGGSCAVFHNYRYELFMMDLENQALAYPRYVYHLLSGGISKYQYSTSDANVRPFGVCTAPLSHEDYGNRHPLYARGQTGGTDYNVYVGDFKTTDGGNSYTCSIAVLIDLVAPGLVKPRRVFAVYKGLGSIVLSFSSGSYLQSTPALAASPTVDGAAQLTVARANVSPSVLKSGGILLRAQFSPASGAQLLKLQMDYDPEEYLN